MCLPADYTSADTSTHSYLGGIETLHHLEINEIGEPEADVRVVEMAAFDVALDEGHGGELGKTGPS